MESSAAPRHFFSFLTEPSTTDSNSPSPPRSPATSIDAQYWKLGYDSPEDSPVVEDVLDILSQFKRGEDEARKYLAIAHSAIKALDDLEDKSLKRKTLEWDEERSKKQFAKSPEEVEIWEMIDKLLLSDDDVEPVVSKQESKFSIGKYKDPGGGLIRKRGGRGGKKKEVVDLWSLLVQCARAVATYDRETVESLLSIIRKHSSPLGDGSQRFAHYLADGLEGRLSDWGLEAHSSLACNKAPVMDILKAHKLLSTTPMKRIPMEFAKENILKISGRSSTLHIIDFGIRHGTQWPLVIKLLSSRPGGPPKLRITGIELPEFGFRPALSTMETGRRLEECCHRFGVLFEYNPIVSAKWDTIRIEDLKLVSGETVAVNCLFRFGALLDESAVEVGNPRDAVLRLVRDVRPHIFVHVVLNGSHNSPFFVSRFRETMHHYSSVFDMIDCSVGNADSTERLEFEKVHVAQNLINVIACEGWKRVVRSERYQDWGRRMVSAGLRPMPLDMELGGRIRNLVKSRYHPEFRVEEDGHWLLQGWKGRMYNAMSCWFVPH